MIHHDSIVSTIRTAVPAAVGAVLAWMAAKLGIVIDAETGTAGIAFFTSIATAGYYAAVRFAAAKIPAAGILLGVNKAPSYTA